MRRIPVRTQILIILGLLAVAVAVNYSYFGVPGGTDQGGSDAPAPPPGPLVVEPSDPVDPVDPVGPADAPVKLEVFYEADNPCHGEVEPDARQFAARYGRQMRLELLPWHAEGTQERAEELEVECLVTVSVRANTKESGDGKDSVKFKAPAEIGGWTWEEVAEAVETEMAKAGVTPQPDESVALPVSGPQEGRPPV